MSMPRHGGHEPDDLIGLIDQGSFLGLRALGRGLVLQFTWLLERLPSEADVLLLNQRLSQGLFARRIRRSSLPWGRHRWVKCPVPAQPTWFDVPLPVENLSRLRRRLLDLDVDPEHGPGWRLVAQPLAEGGCALTVLASHTIADGKGCVETIADAVAGRHVDLGYPAPSEISLPGLVVRDLVVSLRGIPDLWRAVKALLQRPRAAPSPLAMGSAPIPRGRGSASLPVVDIPVVELAFAADGFAGRALELETTVNTLLAALAVRIAHAVGRVDAAGRVRLTLPVSDRQQGDRRGNALRAASLTVNPEACISSLVSLQSDLGAAIQKAREDDGLTAMLPLIPYVPLWMARTLERFALGPDIPVGCSILGRMPRELESPCGEASSFHIGALERYRAADLEQLGGLMLMISNQMRGRIFVSVSAYVPGRVTDTAALGSHVRRALAELGLLQILH